jgi:TonB family protein
MKKLDSAPPGQDAQDARERRGSGEPGDQQRRDQRGLGPSGMSGRDDPRGGRDARGGREGREGREGKHGKEAKVKGALREPKPDKVVKVPKVLRVGIIQRGKITEERLIRQRENVTIGESPRNTFVIPSPSMPRSFALFEVHHHARGPSYALNFFEGMDGRVAVGNQVFALDNLRLQGKLHRRGDLHIVPLNEQSRGKVTIDEVTVLFQFVVPPPPQPMPKLPPSVRGSFGQQLDGWMAAMVAISFIIHAGFVTYLRNVDFPRKPAIEEVPDRFARLIAPPKIKIPEPTKTPEGVGPEKKTEDADKAGASKGDKGKGPRKRGPAGPPDPEAEARAAAERRARLEQEVASFGIPKLLTGRGEGGALDDVLRGSDAGGDADSVFDRIGGVQVAGAGGGGQGGLRSSKGGGGSGRTTSIEGLRSVGPAAGGTGDKGPERAVRANLRYDRPNVDGSLAPDVIMAEVRRRKQAIQNCFERALKRNEGLSGRIVVRFTISAVGKVVSVSIDEDSVGDPEVAACIRGHIMQWRFPAPEGGTVETSIPFIFQSAK